MHLDVVSSERLRGLGRETCCAAKETGPSEFFQHTPMIRHNGGMIN